MASLNHYRRGQGEPLVLIHGIGSLWQMWEPVLDGLVTDRDVVALDLPGFGASAMPPPGTPPGVDSLVTLVQDFLAQEGIDRPHLAGNSLGGLIVLELARRGLARSATALSPAGFANRPETALAQSSLWLGVRLARRFEGRADTLLATRTGRRVALGLGMERAADLPVAQAAATVRALARAPWFDATLPTIGPLEFGPGQRPIPVPVTIGWGTKDRLLLPRQAKRAAALIPNARIVRLEGCGHVPTFDDPPAVTRLLLDGSAAKAQRA
ncbi:MAG: alpha/beta fold hydrolase [Solirubrobacteraceae bacterium]